MKMRTFQRLWSRILILVASGGLLFVTTGIWEPPRSVKLGMVVISTGLGFWGVVWEHWRGDRRKLRRDSFFFKRFFSKWYNRPGGLVICCGSLSWLTVRNGSKTDSSILDALTLSNNRIAVGSKLIVITAEIDNDQLKELWKRLNPHSAIEIYKVDENTIKEFSFSRYAAAGDAFQYIIKYNEEDKDGFIIEHTNVSEKAFINNLISCACIPANAHPCSST